MQFRRGRRHGYFVFDGLLSGLNRDRCSQLTSVVAFQALGTMERDNEDLDGAGRRCRCCRRRLSQCGPVVGSLLI